MSTVSAKRPAPLSASPCPCGSGATYGACCEPLLKQERVAATAEELMRSRFTAHFVGDHRHLHRTYLGTANQPYAEEATEGVDPTWTRLVIHAHGDGPKPETAFVDFSAYSKDDGVEQVLHEKGEFSRLGGTWFYVRALRLGPAPVKAAPKIGRNDPCSCGSGKKFKHCCGR